MCLALSLRDLIGIIDVKAPFSEGKIETQRCDLSQSHTSRQMAGLNPSFLIKKKKKDLSK